MDGAEIFNNLCTGCHTSGVGNAPTMDKSHWAARITQGTETLYTHAIDGYTGPDGGIMQPKGGNPALTDEQVKATVDWMLTNLASQERPRHGPRRRIRAASPFPTDDSGKTTPARRLRQDDFRQKDRKSVV